LKQTISEQDRQIARNQQALVTSALKIQKREEALRLERVKKYGKQSEKLSDLQLQLLDLEPGVSSDEVQSEIERGPLPASNQESDKPTDKQRRARRNHPGRNELPAHLHPADEGLSVGTPALERVEKIIPCAPESIFSNEVIVSFLISKYAEGRKKCR